jgi:hypothetical protein
VCALVLITHKASAVADMAWESLDVYDMDDLTMTWKKNYALMFGFLFWEFCAIYDTFTVLLFPTQVSVHLWTVKADTQGGVFGIGPIRKSATDKVLSNNLLLQGAILAPNFEKSLIFYPCQ